MKQVNDRHPQSGKRTSTLEPRLELKREVKGLILLYGVFALLGLLLAGQCVTPPKEPESNSSSR